MDAMIDKTLMSQIRTLSPQQVAEGDDFVEFLAAKARKRTAMDRLLGCRDRDVDPSGRCAVPETRAQPACRRLQPGFDYFAVV